MIPGLDSGLVWPMLPGIRRRNETFDFLFYDTGRLTEREKDDLIPLDNGGGSVIAVSPTDSPRPIRSYADPASFVAAEAERVRALVVAGVGSSAIGTAALARSVADACGFDVAGVVSGYGASDWITEAFGGWFFYGASGAWRQHLHFAIENFDALLKGNPYLPRINLHRSQRQGISRGQGDARTLCELLQSPALELDLVVGHSKGSLVLDFALEEFVDWLDGRGHRYFETLQIVTFGAVSRFPREFRRVAQFLGEIDWFGSM